MTERTVEEWERVAEDLRKERDRLDRVLAVERGDEAQAPRGWTLGGDGSWRAVRPYRVVSFVNNATSDRPAFRHWLVEARYGIQSLHGHCSTALEAMEAADRAAGGEG